MLKATADHLGVIPSAANKRDDAPHHWALNTHNTILLLGMRTMYTCVVLWDIPDSIWVYSTFDMINYIGFHKLGIFL